jgi:hypothetical protein
MTIRFGGHFTNYFISKINFFYNHDHDYYGDRPEAVGSERTLDYKNKFNGSPLILIRMSTDGDFEIRSLQGWGYKTWYEDKRLEIPIIFNIDIDNPKKYQNVFFRNDNNTKWYMSRDGTTFQSTWNIFKN